MSAYLTFTREKTLDETDGPTDLQANSLRPMTVFRQWLSWLRWADLNRRLVKRF
jgi:hypothetical protein